uniref:Uncharacterized protein n=1 Tax=Oryza brachyantha TaxID=4533 RepID=J3KYU3_ORYBR
MAPASLPLDPPPLPSHFLSMLCSVRRQIHSFHSLYPAWICVCLLQSWLRLLVALARPHGHGAASPAPLPRPPLQEPKPRSNGDEVAALIKEDGISRGVTDRGGGQRARGGADQSGLHLGISAPIVRYASSQAADAGSSLPERVMDAYFHVFSRIMHVVITLLIRLVRMTKYECIDHVHYGDNLILALFLNKSSKIICEIDNVGILPYPSFQSGQCKVSVSMSNRNLLDFFQHETTYTFYNSFYLLPWNADQQQHFLVVAFHLWLFPTNLLIILLFQRDKSHGLKGSTLKWS